jgi:hypothetical protein
MRLRAEMLRNALGVETREAETLALVAEGWDGTRASDWWHAPESIWNGKPYEPSVLIYPAMMPNQIQALASNDRYVMNSCLGTSTVNSGSGPRHSSRRTGAY